jgi:ABC-2 type transport system ATP-binding protein
MIADQHRRPGEAGELTARGLSAEQVGQLALDHGILLHYLAPARVSLEEAFMELTADSVEYQAKTGSRNDHGSNTRHPGAD